MLISDGHQARNDAVEAVGKGDALPVMVFGPSDPDPTATLRFLRRVILALGYFPRGRIQRPKHSPPLRGKARDSIAIRK